MLISATTTKNVEYSAEEEIILNDATYALPRVWPTTDLRAADAGMGIFTRASRHEVRWLKIGQGSVKRKEKA